MKKAVRQYSKHISDFKEIETIALRYKNVRNYVYSRYSGVNSLHMLKNYKKQIRDVWVKSKFAKQWGLLDRYWKLALDEAIANIKSEWSNTKNRIKKAVRENDNLTEDEKYFIYYVLKSDEILHKILSRTVFALPKKLEKLIIRSKYIFNLISRYVRRYKNIPYSHRASSFQIDADMYEYKMENGNPFLEFASLRKMKRLRVELTDKSVRSGNLRIVLKNNYIEVHSTVDIKQKQLWNSVNTVGIDKGYKNLFAASSDNFYGCNLNEMLSEETERLNEKNKKRNKIWAQVQSLKEAGDTKKAEVIIKNNFGKKKYINHKNRHDEKVKSYINQQINLFIRNELPSEIVSEELSFVSWDDRYPKHVKRKLSRWIKGYIRERLEYKCHIHNISYTLVNAAYTSQTCHKCGHFGKRKNDAFVCKNCGKMHADTNASKNILKRKYDKEITLHTPYKKVKEILENRLLQTVSV